MGKINIKIQSHINLLLEKIKESAISVLPIVIIVALLCFFIIPIDPSLLLAFVVATFMIILGMGMFTLGAETSMTVIGNRIGSSLTKSKKLWLMPISG